MNTLKEQELVTALSAELRNLIDNWLSQKQHQADRGKRFTVKFSLKTKSLSNHSHYQPPSVLRELKNEDWERIFSVGLKDEWRRALNTLRQGNNKPISYDLFPYASIPQINIVFKNGGLPYRLRQNPGTRRDRDSAEECGLVICVLPGS